MTYSNVTEFRDRILDYLITEKTNREEDIKANEQLSDAQKIEEGFLIERASVTSSMHPFYDLSLSENNTKLRPGDKVRLTQGKKSIDVKVIENTEGILSVESNIPLSEISPYKVEVREFVLLDPLIKLAEQIEDGAPGSYWMELLAQLEVPEKVGFKPIDSSVLSSATLNPEQIECCKNVLNRPSAYCLQGPPGTGKTDVLAILANAYSSKGHEVLIISNTHQAVNNALNKIRKFNQNNPIVKIGESLKGEGLVDGIVMADTYSRYLSVRKKVKKKKIEKSNDIVGMTFQAAVANLGLRKSGFLPSIILVDEAGQMPLSQGALIGAFGSGTIVLIGDDLQMPPIYHEKLADNPLSVSIFTHLCRLYPDCKTVLTTTYRMNSEITDAVSKNYYQPHGITLDASDFSANRKLKINANTGDSRIDDILKSEKSIHQIDVSTDDIWEDDNHEEAKFVANLVKASIDGGISARDVAVITPYRRQVKAIRAYVREALGADEELPLIDTVERLQGQDVDMIIISESATNPGFWKAQESFILNPNRLNVMLSRAKKKVVIVGKHKIL